MASCNQAFAEARKGKLNTVNEQRFEENRDIELIKLAEAILNKTYVPTRSVAFIITEPMPRDIFAASFRDRVIHHFLGNGFGFRRKIAPKIKSRPVLGFIFGYDSVMELSPHVVRAKRSLANIPVLDGT